MSDVTHAAPGARGDPVAAWCELAGPRTDVCEQLLHELARNGVECGAFDGAAQAGLVLFESWSDALRDLLQERARDGQVIAVGVQRGSLGQGIQDFWRTHSFLAQIAGRKEAILFAPISKKSSTATTPATCAN
jgi:hypothetical protein